MTRSDPRPDIIQACHDMTSAQLVSGLSGNISARDPQGAWITPSGMAYDALEPEDMVLVGWDGEVKRGRRRPSVEKGMHLACYQADPTIGAVVHAHPVYLSVLAINGEVLPVVLDSLAGALGGPVPVVPYAPSATSELAALVGDRIASHRALILQNHGLVVAGDDVRSALTLAVLVERTAMSYVLARAIGTPAVLPEGVVKERREFVLTRYGQKEEKGAPSR